MNPALRRAQDITSRLLFRLDQQLAGRLLQHGPRGRPLMLLGDRFSTVMFRARRAWHEARRGELAAAASPEACLAITRRVLGVNQKREEIIGFLDWVRPRGPRRLCEIGVEGGGTHLLLKHALRPELTVGIDLYVRRKEQLEGLAPRGQRTVFVDGSSSDPETVRKVSEVLGGQSLDLLFIDGDHSFAGAARDFELYRPLVARGGVIAFHDIVEDSLTRTGFHTGTYVGGVPVLWRQLRAQYPEHREFVGSWSQDGYGIGAIVYDPDVTPRLDPPASD